MTAIPAKVSRFSPFLAKKNNLSALISTSFGSSNLLASNDEEVSIEQQLADAFNANNDVMSYVIGVTGTVLPTLSGAPEWYTKFQEAFTSIQINANSWYSIAANLVSIPNSIAAYGLAFNASMSTINAFIGILKVDPNNVAAINSLKGQLQNLSQQLKVYASIATNFKGSIENFNSCLVDDAKIMSQAVQDSLNTQGADKEKVDQFVKDIKALQAEVKTWQTVITASAIGAGVGFFAGAVVGIFSLGLGLAFGIVAAVAGITTMIAASVKVRELNNKILASQAEMDRLNQEIASLAALDDQINELIKLSQAAGEQVDLVIQVWEKLQSELNQVISDLEACEADVSPLDLNQLEIDLALANSDWENLVDLCGKISSISYSQATPVSSEIN
ncbi:MAG: hypothetical protein ACI4NJ_11625 [Cellvibrio sp.]